MTKEEAIKRLKTTDACDSELCEALDMAIEALEREHCDDAISRQAVDRIINKWLSYPDYELKDEIYDMTKKIHKLPSVTPQPCGDYISREETLKALMDEWTEYDSELIDYLIEKIDKLPSVTPQIKIENAPLSMIKSIREKED